MHAGEGMRVLLDAMKQDAKCEFKPPNATWKCNLNGSGPRLRQWMIDSETVVEPSKPSSLAELSSGCWHSQAHHLIPKNQLKNHAVTIWLDDAPPKAKPAKLYEDNNYDVDHWRNGKFMPYASELPEWKNAKSADEKLKILRRVMAVAGIQLHQGQHTFTRYAAGETGYQTRADEYLTAIKDNSSDHYKPPEGVPPCEDCKSKEQAGKKAPRKNVVRFVDKASERLEVDINQGRIYVSRQAAEFAAAGGVMG